MINYLAKKTNLLFIALLVLILVKYSIFLYNNHSYTLDKISSEIFYFPDQLKSQGILLEGDIILNNSRILGMSSLTFSFNNIEFYSTRPMYNRSTNPEVNEVTHKLNNLTNIFNFDNKKTAINLLETLKERDEFQQINVIIFNLEKSEVPTLPEFEIFINDIGFNCINEVFTVKYKNKRKKNSYKYFYICRK